MRWWCVCVWWKTTVLFFFWFLVFVLSVCDNSTIYRKFHLINFNQIKWVGWLVREMKKWISQFVSENVTKINIFNQRRREKKIIYKWHYNNFWKHAIGSAGTKYEQTGACFTIPPVLGIYICVSVCASTKFVVHSNRVRERERNKWEIEREGEPRREYEE